MESGRTGAFGGGGVAGVGPFDFAVAGLLGGDGDVDFLGGLFLAFVGDLGVPADDDADLAAFAGTER